MTSISAQNRHSPQQVWTSDMSVLDVGSMGPGRQAKQAYRSITFVVPSPVYSHHRSSPRVDACHG